MKNSTQTIDSETLYDLKFVGDPQISPDGKRIVYIITSINAKKKYDSHVFMFDRQTGQSTQWTHGEGRHRSPRWAPDGNTIAFVSDRSGENQIWTIGAGGGESFQVTDVPNGASNPVWHPLENKLLFQTSLEEGQDLYASDQVEKDESPKPYVVDQLHYKADGKGLLDTKRTQLALVNLENETIDQITSGPFDHTDPAWSPDGLAIAFIRPQSDHPGSYMLSDLYIQRIGEDPYRINKKSGGFAKPTWSPDGKSLSYFGHLYEYEGATQTNVWVMTLDTNHSICLTASSDLECSDVLISDLHWANPSPGAVWKLDGQGVYFQASKQGNTGIYYACLDGEVSKVVGGNRHVYAFNYHATSDEAILGMSSPTHIGDLFSVSLPDKRKVQLTTSNDLFEKQHELIEPEGFKYKSMDGTKVEGWLMKPAHFDSSKTYPLLLEIHGGPHMMYGNSFMHEFQLLASKGYAVLYTNPRGSHGYGQTFVNACRGDYGGGDYEDIIAGVDAVLEKYSFIDENQLFVTGGSYGGFMTNWIVGRNDRFKAAVTQRSISNWQSFYGVSDIGHFFTKWEIGNHFTENPTKLWDHSPIKYVNQINTPLLIIHSEKDYRCPIEQGEQLFVALKNKNKTTKFVRFPDSDHNLSRTGLPSLRVERLNHIVNWFQEYRN
ncbi:S9 family peptidase [Pontibacillus salipaludis]|uniref:Peptidase YuxL n=1 Tax=Pontibacillus salipaludis TaxID=1697394 RepID=A0ABQ1Q250_9BACI|nr:S9 family peptidase [Pontibacillus salipaludis]GGD10383.1 putative peptidase YuxL [Pontibacillus salipaludis]